MKKFIALCSIIAVFSVMSSMSFADSGASHYYKSHKETASVTAPSSNYSIYIGVEVWNKTSNLKYAGGSKTTTFSSRSFTKYVSHSGATRGYHTYMTKNPTGNVVANLSHYGWDT